MIQMTKTERKYFDAWVAQMPGVTFTAETDLDFIWEDMEKTAYHEAGHAAADAFLGVEDPSHFEGLSIIPNQDNKGCYTQSQILSLQMYIGGPKSSLQEKGKTRIICLLAGRVAENKMNGGTTSLEDELIDGWELFLCDSEEEWRKNVDEGKALEIAEVLSNKYWPPLRILLMLEKWTHELIEIPAVWGIVETLAQKLIAEGEITDSDEYYDIIKPIFYRWIGNSLWKRRFLSVPKEPLHQINEIAG